MHHFHRPQPQQAPATASGATPTTGNSNIHGEPSSTGATGGGGGGFLSKLRGQAEAALARLPSSTTELEANLRAGMVSVNPRQSPHTVKVQLAVKTAKGVVVDSESLARESKAFSKTLLDFTKSQNHATGTSNEDLVDVGDRMALLVYKTGELHAEYAKTLEQARGHLKDIRNSETALNAQRDRRSQLSKEIAKLRASNKQDVATTTKISSLQNELDEFTRAGSPLSNAEATALTLRRQKLKESFGIQFQALQELGEKLAIVGVYGRALAEGFDVSATAGTSDYTGSARTAAIRNGLEQDLATWSVSKARTPQPALPDSRHLSSSAAPGAGVHSLAASASYAPSFSETHANELAAIPSDPFADHSDALESYYPQTSSPPSHAQKPASIHSHDSHAAVAHASVGPAGAGAGTAASPLVSNLNFAPVSGVNDQAGSTGSLGHHRQPSGSSSLSGVANGGSAASPPPVLQPPPQHPSHSAGGVGLGSTTTASPGIAPVLPATDLPTIAETGAPIHGTGGPSSGVLAPPSQRKTKEEEAREDTQKRFEGLRENQAGGPSNQAIPAGRAGADLERDYSLRGRQAGEQLPAYTTEQSEGSK